MTRPLIARVDMATLSHNLLLARRQGRRGPGPGAACILESGREQL